MSLWTEFNNHTGRPIHKWKHYLPVYERHFDRYVNRPLTFLEIGCGLGGSAQLWKNYFGPHAQIIGIDIVPQCLEYAEDQIAIRLGSQDDLDFLEKIVDEFGPIDVVLDDGSHIQQHIRSSFAYLYPRIAADGVYLVEDLHTAYWDGWEGGLRRPGTFIETCKSLIDELHAGWTAGELPATDFTRMTQSMHFYDSIAVFERGRTLARSSVFRPSLPEKKAAVE